MKAIGYLYALMAISASFFVATAEDALSSDTNMKRRYYPSTPSIFLLLRRGTTYEEIEDWTRVVNAALPKSMRSEDLSKIADWENIIIVDEGNSWAVSFHHKGNGMLAYHESANGLKDWAMTIEDGDGLIIYLNKETLRKTQAPKKGLIAAPTPWNPKVKKDELNQSED